MRAAASSYGKKKVELYYFNQLLSYLNYEMFSSHGSFDKLMDPRRRRSLKWGQLLGQSFCCQVKYSSPKVIRIGFDENGNIELPESYDAEPDCAPSGSISGFTFINFVMWGVCIKSWLIFSIYCRAAASVGANVVNNANSNNNNNNNNNNDNNININNFMEVVPRLLEKERKFTTDSVLHSYKRHQIIFFDIHRL